jgi:hypothetical protein
LNQSVCKNEIACSQNIEMLINRIKFDVVGNVIVVVWHDAIAILLHGSYEGGGGVVD